MKMTAERRALDKIFRRRDRYDIPDWQREEVWDTAQKQCLIDSILRGWKLPKFYFVTRGLAGRVSDSTPPVSPLTPRVSSGVSEQVSAGVSLHPREKTERWNLHLPKDLIATIKAKAQALGVHPSELVAEVLRQWLAEET
jgi:hypothetical protein